MDWHFVFKVKDGEVHRVCQPTSASHRTRRFHCNPHMGASDSDAARRAEDALKVEFGERLKRSQNCIEPLRQGDHLHLPKHSHLTRVVSLSDDGCVELGNSGLMLNIITPLQKFSKGGTTISDVIRQRFLDLFRREISSDSLSEAEAVYIKKKEDRMKLQQVRLLVELFTCEDISDAEQSSSMMVPRAENLVFRTSSLSDVITNSKSKECGPLQLHDVNPNISCCESETKIVILSFFKVIFKFVFQK